MSIVEDSTELISLEWPEGEPQIGDQLTEKKNKNWRNSYNNINKVLIQSLDVLKEQYIRS